MDAVRCKTCKHGCLEKVRHYRLNITFSLRQVVVNIETNEVSRTSVLETNKITDYDVLGDDRKQSVFSIVRAVMLIAGVEYLMGV